jgi:hypothetical protein|tara:strand:+ start:1800 stop:2135 length:336 start_codon:yes stop_codon:yes gene_type:complete
MLLNTSIIVAIVCWVITAVLMAAAIGAMFSPDKEKLFSRLIISSLLLIPSLAIVPLSFAAFILLCIMSFIILISIFGIRTAIELIRDGVPEMDEDGNIIEDKTVKPTAPWV